MTMARILYDGFCVLYALSLVLFFSDVIHPRRSVNRTALILLFTAFMLETSFLVVRLADHGYAPLYSPFDAMLLLAWMIMLAALVFAAFFRIDLLLFLANVVGFAVVVFATFGRMGDEMYTAKQGDLLLLHVLLALLSYAAFSLSFVFSLMYLMQDRLLREKQWNHWFFRLGSLERLDTYAYRAILVGFPSLTLAMVLGLMWSQLTLGHLLWWDPKPIATVILWLMYFAYLILRLRAGWGARELIKYNLVCFAGVLINFFVVGSFSFTHAVS